MVVLLEHVRQPAARPAASSGEQLANSNVVVNLEKLRRPLCFASIPLFKKYATSCAHPILGVYNVLSAITNPTLTNIFIAGMYGTISHKNASFILDDLAAFKASTPTRRVALIVTNTRRPNKLTSTGSNPE